MGRALESPAGLKGKFKRRIRRKFFVGSVAVSVKTEFGPSVERDAEVEKKTFGKIPRSRNAHGNASPAVGSARCGGIVGGIDRERGIFVIDGKID